MSLKYIILFIIAAGIINSCSPTKIATSNKSIKNFYMSVFPNNEVSDELGSIIKSIKMVNSITFYKRYDFKYGLITKNGFEKGNGLQKAFSVSNINKTSSGTSTIISAGGSKVALLTAAHIVIYPDTIIEYYIDNGVKTKFISSIALKVRQQIYADLPDGGGLRIIAKDEKLDLAVVGNSFSGITPLNAPVLNFKFGSAKELKWGSFIYIVGFPLGKKMVTRGIVSLPKKSINGNFLVDALINKGSSGGLVFAIRGESTNFELVGLVSSVSAVKNFVLAPYDPNYKLSLISGAEYSGEMAIKRLDSIKYGIGKIISVETIRDFFKKHKKEILKKGFDLTFL